MHLRHRFIWQPQIGCRALLAITFGVAVFALAATADRAWAISGTIDFGVTHNNVGDWTILDEVVTDILVDDTGDTEANPSPQQAVEFDIDVAGGVANIKMSRDEGRELVTVPIPGGVVSGGVHTWRVRTRFKLTAEDYPINGTPEDIAGGTDCAWFGCDGHGPDIHVGFFDSTDLKVGPGDLDFVFGGDNDTTAIVIESTGVQTYAARVAGGSYGRTAGQFPEGSTHFGSTDTWYVMEMSYRPEEGFDNELFMLDGVTLDPIVDPTSGLEVANGTVTGAADTIVNELDLIGFGNVDIVHETGTITAAVDWITWAIDEALPADPPNAPVPVVNGQEFLDLQVNNPGGIPQWEIGYGTAALTAAVSAVPEPGTFLLSSLAMLAWMTGGCRKQS